jgi:hypothetical protein
LTQGNAVWTRAKAQEQQMNSDQIVEVWIVKDVIVQEAMIEDPIAKDAIVKVMGMMTKIWDYQPGADKVEEWKTHAAWLVQAIAERRPREEMDWYMSRVQLRLGMAESMSFRKIVDRAIELLAETPTPAEANRIEKLNPTVA